MTEILADPHQTGVVVVTTPEELPVNETLELVDRLGATVPVRTAAVVVNRVLPELFTHDEEAVFAGVCAPGRGAGAVEEAGGVAVEGERRRRGT